MTVEDSICSFDYNMNREQHLSAGLPRPTGMPGAWRQRWLFAVGGALAALAVSASGDSAMLELPRDKSGYHLFNPTPRELLRDLSTDRPDQTESPRTVDAGHFQVELDLVNATFDRDQSNGGDVRTTDFALSALNLKVGLWNNVDLQFVFDPYLHSRVEDRGAGTVAKARGVGDLQTRLNINFWGNEGGRTALGLMPFVKWPLPESSLRNGRTEGGIIVPFAMELGGGWGLGAMAEFDFVADGAGGHDVEFFNTVTFGHDLVGNLGGYVEFASLVTPESNRDWQGQMALGFTLGLNENTQLDFGCNFGVTRTAPNFNPFVGLSWRH